MVRQAGCPVNPSAGGNNRDWLSAELEEPTLPVPFLIRLQELAVFLTIMVQKGSLHEIEPCLDGGPRRTPEWAIRKNTLSLPFAEVQGPACALLTLFPDAGLHRCGLG